MSDTEFKLVKPDFELVPAIVRHGQIVCDHLETCVRELAIRGYIVSRVATVQGDYEAFLAYVVASNHQSLTAMGWQHPEAGYIDVAPLVPATSGRPEHISTFDTSAAQFAVVGLSAADRAVWIAQIDAWRAGVAERPADGSAYEDADHQRASDDGMPEPPTGDELARTLAEEGKFAAAAAVQAIGNLYADIQAAIDGHRSAGQVVKRILARDDAYSVITGGGMVGVLGSKNVSYIDEKTRELIPVFHSTYALSDPFVIVAEVAPSAPVDAVTAEANVPAAESVNPDAAEILGAHECDEKRVNVTFELDDVEEPHCDDAHNEQDDSEADAAAVLNGLAAMGADIHAETPGSDAATPAV